MAARAEIREIAPVNTPYLRDPEGEFLAPDDFDRWSRSAFTGPQYREAPIVSDPWAGGHFVFNPAKAVEDEEPSSNSELAGLLAGAIVNGGDDVVLLVRSLTKARDPVAIDALREGIARLSDAFERIAQTHSEDQLRQVSADHTKEDFRALLRRVADDYGLSWHTIASMLGVTPTAIRKWRRGGSITAENREQVSVLSAFFDQLGGLEIADLGSWIEMRVHENTTLTPADIYRSGPQGRWLLLERARGRIDAVAMLDRFDRTWRKTYARDPNFRVVRGSDGERAIVPR